MPGTSLPELRYLSAADVVAAMPGLDERLKLAERTLTALVAEAELPPKIGVHPRPSGSFVHAMPAFLRGQDPDGGDDRIGMKWVAGFASNNERALPAVNAVVVLNDAATGIPTAILDGEVAMVLPDGEAGELLDAAHRVASGGSAVDPAVIAELVKARRRDDRLTRLTDREREMLTLLAANPGETVPRLALAGTGGNGGNGGAVGERAVDVQINRLRRKIERDPANPLFVQTVRGVGYRLVATP